ncbi:peptide ABC transporter substrate-binding protein [Bifidobacterium pseudolongum PV8-2]|uniref:Peptide ABC transporter substrate-binding protein n=1 Tax=Bifidobacterium pseudolongum PV8-2 TaxID=1447715 RepID=A0A0A7ICT7_9BIFI|nr:peptide ABC transporter substrate-binding protein [Bifidobacterium pseudolongum PV8-2]
MTAQSGRNTRQKDVIREALGACDVFISAQALHQRLVDGGEHISLATVYRRLNAMADSGQADTVRMNGQQMFRLCGDERHHHHLVCVSCGRTVQIDPPSETWLRSIAEEHGFTVESHTLEVFGLCAQCRAARAQSDGADAGEGADDAAGADDGESADASASSFGLNDESMPSASRKVSDGR